MNRRKTYIIAEAGVNHNGSFELAMQLVDAAAAAGADCVKFQTFRPESLVTRNAKKAEYQIQNTNACEGQREMLEKLMLSHKDFQRLAQYAASKNIDFTSTPFDEESVCFVHELGIPFWKIPSGEVTNLPYLEQIARYQEPIVMSTGMCSMEEIRQAVMSIKRLNQNQLVLLHCNTEYPTPVEDVNLMAMEQLQKEFHCPVGYSDHTSGIEIPIAAAALGAAVIEKHFTLDKSLDGPDHKASLEPDELCRMIQAIRNVECALGNGEKVLQESEKKNRTAARKSIVARIGIKKGELLTEENLTAKRPGNGISPMRWREVIGTAAVRDFKEDEQIEILEPDLFGSGLSRLG